MLTEGAYVERDWGLQMNHQVSWAAFVALGLVALGCGQTVRTDDAATGGTVLAAIKPDAGKELSAAGGTSGTGGGMAAPTGGGPVDGGRWSGDAATVALTDAGPAGEADAGPTELVDATMQATGQVVFQVQTKASGTSQIAPRHVAAVWVESGQGQRVRLLARYGAVSARFLLTYKQVWPEYLWAEPLPPDVVSTATLPRFQLLSVEWDLKDERGAIVPDGRYVVVVDATDSNQTSWVQEVPFDKGSDPVTIDLPETEFFGAIHLEYSPD